MHMHTCLGICVFIPHLFWLLTAIQQTFFLFEKFLPTIATTEFMHVNSSAMEISKLFLVLKIFEIVPGSNVDDSGERIYKMMVYKSLFLII
jgi:hypothetical protein